MDKSYGVKKPPAVFLQFQDQQLHEGQLVGRMLLLLVTSEIQARVYSGRARHTYTHAQLSTIMCMCVAIEGLCSM